MPCLMCCNTTEEEIEDNEKRKCLMRIIITVFLITILIGLVLAGVWYRSGKHQARSDQVDIAVRKGITKYRKLNDENANNETVFEIASKIAAVAEHPLCTETGRKILFEGGSAVDAGIAMLFCQGVVEPHYSGLGGGFLMLIYIHDTKEVITLDARGTAPVGASATMFDRRSPADNADIQIRKGLLHAYRQGWLTITIPGEALGLWEAHIKYGKLPWRQLVEPAIRLASFGFPVSKSLALHSLHYNDTIERDAVLRKMLINTETNETYKEGDDIHNEALAKVLMKIAADGVDHIYKGDGSARIADESIDKGGIFIQRDFSNYKVKWSLALPHVFRDGDDRPLTLYVPPPPSCAMIIAMIINIVNGREDMLAHNSNSTGYTAGFYHKVVEAMKHSFARKGLFGDALEIPMKDILKFLRLQWGSLIRELISSTSTFSSRFYKKNISQTELQNEDLSTCNIGAVAPNGDAIVASSSLNDPFGAGVVSESLGFLLNNYMLSFTHTVNKGEDSNVALPGKRPLTSMSPIIILDDIDNFKLLMVAAGGTRIPSSTALILMRYFWYGYDLSVATTTHRLHHQLIPNIIVYEGPPKELNIEFLRTYGHKLSMTLQGWPHVDAIVYENGSLISISDNHDRP